QNAKEGKVDPVSVLSNPCDIDFIFSGEKKTMVLFEMTACPYCRMFANRFFDFAAERSGDYDFLRVTLDDPGNPLWHKYEIHTVPMVMVVAGGGITARLDSVPFLGITKKKWAEFLSGV
ncbi:MAG: thioredoxin family protein, partial [Thermodesulfovibrionales bacterium]|nr:thioredoxin family protein [Thermodesulfovibrionales bacterium]